MADFNNVNYDRIFRKNDKNSLPGKASSVMSRLGGILFGGMFGGTALVMAIFLIWTFYSDLAERVNYNTAKAAITSVTGSLKDSQITIKWKFNAENKTYTGDATAHESSEEKLFKQFSLYKTGQPITVMYDPANPAENKLYSQFNPTTIFMLLFVIPFIATGYMIATGAMQNKTSTSTQGTSIVLLFLLCCPAAFIFAFMAEKFSAAFLLPIFFAYTFIIIPSAIRTIRRKLDKKKADPQPEKISTRTIQQDEPAESESDETESDVPQNLSFKKEISGVLFFTGFWWLIVGIFIGIMGYQIYCYTYAKNVFKSTGGVVLSSEVESHRGDKSTTYSPLIKYSYTVDGKEYISKKYELANGSSSGGWAGRVVSDHPKGKKVTVYYNPSNPSDAVLVMDIPSFAKIGILFLQPFIMVGVGMLYWIISATIGYLKTRRMESTFNPTQLSRSSLWGKPEIGSDSLQISSKSRPSIFIRFISGYGAACFILIFVAAFKYDFDLSLDQALLALKTAAVIGVLSTVWAIFKYVFARPELFNIDKVTGDISLDSKTENWQLRVGDIKALRLKEVISSTQNNKPQKDYLLEAIDAAGGAHRVHLFKNGLISKSQLLINARRAGETLANFIGCKMNSTIARNEKSVEIPKMLRRFAKFTDKMN